MMDTLLVISTVIIFSVLLIFFLKTELSKLQKPKEDTALIEWLKSMQSSIEQTNRTLSEAMRGTSSDMNRALSNNTKQLNERLDTAARVIGDLKVRLGEMNEIGKGIRSLQEILQSPKLRGNIGEAVLSDMIGQSFPKNSFHLQYSFRSGVKVDAILKTDAGLLPIDAKFPVENFTALVKGDTEEIRLRAKKEFVSDVKKHIADISKKYILPEEGTMDFALMYIPSEAVYYETVNVPDIMKATRDARVYPVSPNTLYAHLQVLLISFQGKDLEVKTKEVFRLLRGIEKDYEKIADSLGTLGKHVTNAYNTMSTVTQGFAVIGQKLDRTHNIGDESPKKSLDN